MGNGGQRSIITTRPNFPTTAAQIILASGNLTGGEAAIGGGLGSTTQGFGNSCEAALVNTNAMMASWGVWKACGDSGNAGTNSNVGAAGSDATYANNFQLPVSQGAGGGSVSTGDVAFAGGNILAAGRMPTGAGGAGGVTGGDGMPGLTMREPFLSRGGAGGGGGTTQGGRGGDGGLGSGGGGGGGGTTGGKGGNGGPGFILIACW